LWLGLTASLVDGLPRPRELFGSLLERRPDRNDRLPVVADDVADDPVSVAS
jgi:hypothetical protein